MAEELGAELLSVGGDEKRWTSHFHLEDLMLLLLLHRKPPMKVQRTEKHEM